VIAIREAEAKQEQADSLGSERVDQLLPHESQSRRAEDHDTLFVQPNDPLGGLEVEHVGQQEILRLHPPSPFLHDPRAAMAERGRR